MALSSIISAAIHMVNFSPGSGREVGTLSNYLFPALIGFLLILVGIINLKRDCRENGIVNLIIGIPFFLMSLLFCFRPPRNRFLLLELALALGLLAFLYVFYRKWRKKKI